MPRHPTIAEAALRLISERGPQELDALAAELVEAGLTRARDPRRAVSAALEFHPGFLRALDGRWCSLAEQLEGAVFTHRLTTRERRNEIVLLGDELSLVERLAARGRPFARGGDVHLDFVGDFFDLPYVDDNPDRVGDDDVLLADLGEGLVDELAGLAREIGVLEETADREAMMEFLPDARYGRLLQGPPGWLPPLLDRQLLGITVRGGALDTVALEEDDVRGPDVELAASRIARLAWRVIGPDPSWFGPATISLEELLVMVASEAPDLLRRPLPPLAEVLELGGLELSDGRVAHRGTDWQSVRWEIPRFPDDAWGFEPPEVPA